MITEDKVTEIFCIADDFCKFYDAMMKRYTLREGKKRRYHRDSTMSKAEVILIMILFHDSGYRCLKHFYLDKGYISKKLLERLFINGIQLITKLRSTMKGALMSVSDRAFHNLVVDLLSGIAAYCLFPKKPTINIERSIDNQLALF